MAAWDHPHPGRARLAEKEPSEPTGPTVQMVSIFLYHVLTSPGMEHSPSTFQVVMRVTAELVAWAVAEDLAPDCVQEEQGETEALDPTGEMGEIQETSPLTHQAYQNYDPCLVKESLCAIMVATLDQPEKGAVVVTRD